MYTERNLIKVLHCVFEIQFNFIVSQFTLYGTTTKGTKPDFHLAMKSDLSCSLYNEFLSRLRQNYDSAKVQDGQFGAHMSVSIVNDGPVTLILESKAKSVVAQ
jgi:D-tyrosyl-tRNA(Tyr) deacylase